MSHLVLYLKIYQVEVKSKTISRYCMQSCLFKFTDFEAALECWLRHASQNTFMFACSEIVLRFGRTLNKKCGI